MGLGGILAAMAGGLGQGMVKISEEAWRAAEKQKYYDFMADESQKERDFKLEESQKERDFRLTEAEKGRKHELVMQERGFAHDMRKSRLAIAAAASRARAGAPSQSDKTYTAKMQELGLYQTKAQAIGAEIVDKYGDISKAPKELQDQLAFLNSKIEGIQTDEAFFNSHIKGEPVKEAMYYTSNGKVGRTNPTDTVQQTAPQVKKEIPKSLRTPNVVDLNNVSQQELDNIVQQRKNAAAQQRLQTEIGNSKAWAKQHQGYNQGIVGSMFQPVNY